MNAFNHSEMHALRLNHGGPRKMVSSELLGAMMARQFSTCYQPIVDVQSTEMLGYEAHTRYWSQSGDALNMQSMHWSLRHNPLLLLHLELGLKKLQISAFPGEGWLMLDMNVDSFFAGGEGEDNPFIAMFKEYAWSDREIVINLVSHGDKQDPWRAQHAMDLLQQSGVTVALEDPGVYWGMFSLSAFLDAAMVKVSSRVLHELDEKTAQAMVDWLVGAARKLGVQTVMTDVETCATLDWARKMGVDCVQGPLFARQNLQVS
ncbi:EAL domain, c-di-GMP-specific phosphodiesterase class I (or its enzymatically inactive variant) [Methylobacillus rhizosphaerae]|uniref:EAL domain, c-di-GMP-specific phosphodiesterase class I (Or its enzymatically inactive variant) n=1 Tax=Methylobacillus rhizosphaerae TaxID=551994 RepID=A0A239A2M9_9PROT|nr:EAL domain-containing protein [Methylobacillus rhizosphaerae]SNR89682.1 EAL domain, c-di-GMP-specific phosphodiesterase class I (or its enzymatically inactive variant) [Methylobacillus rhizosphaerae]